MAIITPQAYCLLAETTVPGPGSAHGQGYAVLPPALLAVEQSVARRDSAQAYALNRCLCRTLLGRFSLKDSPWVLPEGFRSLYQRQLERIDGLLAGKPDRYFDLSSDPFRKDLAILNHRLIPCGAEFVTPFSGIPRRLLFRGGWRQVTAFLGVIARCRGIKPFFELHMHPHYTEAFSPGGWIETYEHLADLLEANPHFLGVQSTSWFLDPVLRQISPHLAYLREIPERCGAVILYAGEDDGESSGALATSRSRRALYAAGHYHPRLFTRIWPRRALLQRSWRS